jgi:hypothetical protein
MLRLGFPFVPLLSSLANTGHDLIRIRPAADIYFVALDNVGISPDSVFIYVGSNPDFQALVD